MAKTKGLNASYEVYKKYYFQQQESMLRRNTFMNEGLLSKKAYKERYEVLRNDFKSDVKHGIRKNIGNVNRQIAREQAYAAPYSHRQASKIRVFLQKENEKIRNRADFDESMLHDTSYLRIRQGESEIPWYIIEDYRKELAAQGYSKTEIAKMVGQNFFGSPK